jgi:Flp pilus assembly protein TadD
MSLINEMLKDLEKRKNREQTVPSIPIANTYASDYSSRLPKLVTPIIIAILLTTSVYMIRAFYSKNHHELQQLQTETKAAPLARTIPNTVDNRWLGLANITGMTLQTKENITELTFMLNHAALYEISTNGMQNQLTIIIEKSQLQSEIPPVRFLNTAIQAINASRINGDMRFNLTLNPNATVKYVNMSSDEKNPELVIAVEYHPVLTPDDAAQKVSSIKTPVMQSLILQKYQLALTEAKVGKFQQAINNLSSVLEVDPEYQDARATLAALLLDKGNPLQASKIVDEGLNINPGYAPFVEIKARLLTQNGKVKQALSLLQSAVPPISENPDYHALIAALYERSNKDVLAVRTYQKLLSLDSHNGSWWFGLAVSYDKLGKSREALSAYEHAMSDGHLNSDSLAYLQKRLETLQEAENDKA